MVGPRNINARHFLDNFIHVAVLFKLGYLEELSFEPKS